MIEHQHTEWKESWRDEHLKWISGFANADGGVLVIGRDDSGRIVGIDNAERLLVELPNKIRWGRGIERIFEACAAAGTPAPEFRHEATGLWIIFPFGAQAAQAAQVEAQEAQVVLSDLERTLLTACRLEARTGKELLAAAAYETRTGSFKRGLERLRALGFFDLAIPDRPTSSRQRYRATAAGHAWLAKAPTKGMKR